MGDTERPMNRTVEICALTLALGACGGSPAGGQLTSASGIVPHIYEIAPEQVATRADTGFIEVNGVGTVSVAPDRATVAFAMESRAAGAAQAVSANADVMDAVLRALRGASLEGLQLETFGYSLRPEYSNPRDGERRVVAYVAVNNVGATVSDVDAVGRLIDTAIGAGANRVSSISFGVSDTDEAESEALALAVADAREQAAVIARSLGRSVGPPLEVRGNAQRPQPPMSTRGMAFTAEMQAAPTPIEAGDQTVTASVFIRFAIGPEVGG